MEIQIDHLVPIFPQIGICKQTVLVIDDSLDTLYLGRYLLEKDGFKVYTASTSDEAFQILNEIEEPDLILLDMQLANMSGVVFLDILEERIPNFLSNVPIVFYSAVDKVPCCKAVGFIRKAGDCDHFLKQVRSFIRQH